MSHSPDCRRTDGGWNQLVRRDKPAPRAITAPKMAEKVWMGTPSQSAQESYSRGSSNTVSPTSNTTVRIESVMPATKAIRNDKT